MTETKREDIIELGDIQALIGQLVIENYILQKRVNKLIEENGKLGELLQRAKEKLAKQEK